MYICLCNAITEGEIRRCAREGARSVFDLEQCLGIGVGCGRCRVEAKKILQEFPAVVRRGVSTAAA